MIGNNKIKKTGFTLTELIVVVAIFALVITSVIGLMLVATQTQRKGIALQNIQDNGRYLLAFMAKEIRVSEIISGDSSDSSVLEINPPDAYDYGGCTNPSVDYITYTFNSGTQQITREACIYVKGKTKKDWDTSPLNSDEVKVTGTFVIDGKATDDNEQPRVTIIMKVESIDTKPKEKAEIELQTTISQRNLD